MDFVQALQEGGYVIFFCHAMAARTYSKPVKGSVSACKNSKHLNKHGNKQTQHISDAFAALSIRLEKIYVADNCPSIETGQKAFGKAESIEAITEDASYSLQNFQQHVLETQRLLSAPVTTGKNRVMISSPKHIQASTGVNLRPGEAAVFRPIDNQGFRFIRKLMPAAWDRIAHQYAATH
jgi:hypothetical protein